MTTDTNTVTIAVTGTLDNGEIFFRTEQNKPMTIPLGEKELPPSVEEVIATMQPGETRKIRVSPEEGYGARQKDLLQEITSSEMAAKLKPTPGMVLSLRAEQEGEERTIPATVIEVDGDTVTVDYNHPLAGHHLTYEITLLDKK